MNASAKPENHGRPWSLWDMINFKFTEAYAALEMVNVKARESLERSLQSRRNVKVEWIDQTTKDEAKRILAGCFSVFGDMDAQGVMNRLFRFNKALERPMSWEDLASEYKVLREAIHDDLKRHHFFHYIPRFSALVVEFDEKWKPVIEGFPSTKDDAFAAIDCIALGYGTAGVFHLMRVLERGIAVLASEVGVDCGQDSWGPIIGDIEAAILKIDKTAKKEEKHRRLPFLSKAASEFRFFKDAWRNYVSHAKSAYDQDQALGVSTHVFEFMSVLCANGLTEARDGEPAA
jgi:hypothetical protein